MEGGFFHESARDVAGEVMMREPKISDFCDYMSTEETRAELDDDIEICYIEGSVGLALMCDFDHGEAEVAIKEKLDLMKRVF